MDLWTPEEKLNYVYGFVKYDMKSIALDFWQDDFIKTRKRYISVLKSRRTGYSFITALKGLVKALDPARTNYVKQFVSYNESDAIEKIRYAKAFYDSIPTRHKKKLVHSNSTELEFLDINKKTTSRLISLPCRPPRGKGGDISLDEYAIYLPKVSDKIYTAALFVIMRGGCIEVGSTPLGSIGKFYEICTDFEKFPNYERYTIPWWFTGALCTDIRRATKEAHLMSTEERVVTFGNATLQGIYANAILEDFQQECECMFIDSNESYIPLELIYKNVPGKRECDISLYENIVDDEEYFNSARDIEINTFKDVDSIVLNYKASFHGERLYLGYDVARFRDGSTFYILGIKKDGKKQSVLNVVLKNTEFEEQKRQFCLLLDNLPIARACIDMTGMGLPIYESLKSKYGEKIEGVNFTIQTKEQLAMSVKFSLEKCEFLLENDRTFHSEIHSIKRIASIGGNFRYDAERNEKGHADTFWAFALANYAAISSVRHPSFYSERKKSKEEKQLLENKSNSNSVQKGKSLQTVLRKIKNC